MTKKRIIQIAIAAVVLIAVVLTFVVPLSFSRMALDDVAELQVRIIQRGEPRSPDTPQSYRFTDTLYRFYYDSDAEVLEQILEILGRYSYRRTLRTVLDFRNSHTRFGYAADIKMQVFLLGRNVAASITLEEPTRSFAGGEVSTEGRHYQMSRRAERALMYEILNVLEGQEPVRREG